MPIRMRRVQEFDVYRHASPLPFALENGDARRICRSPAGICVQRRLRPGSYRFAAVAVDEWEQSFPTVSRKVVVTRRKPGKRCRANNV